MDIKRYGQFVKRRCKEIRNTHSAGGSGCTGNSDVKELVVLLVIAAWGSIDIWDWCVHEHLLKIRRHRCCAGRQDESKDITDSERLHVREIRLEGFPVLLCVAVEALKRGTSSFVRI